MLNILEKIRRSKDKNEKAFEDTRNFEIEYENKIKNAYNKYLSRTDYDTKIKLFDAISLDSALKYNFNDENDI